MYSARKQMVYAAGQKLTVAMQFAACVVLLLQLLAPKTMEAHSCEAKDSFWKDYGLVYYFVAFVFRFFVPRLTEFVYDADNKCRLSCMPDLKRLIQAEALFTDTVNTITTINGLKISKHEEYVVNGALYFCALFLPLVFALIHYLGSNTYERGYKIGKALYLGGNLASTTSMIVSYIINLTYDADHKTDDARSAIWQGVLCSISAIIGCYVSGWGNVNHQRWLGKVQTGADSFYYPAANMLAISQCKAPSAFTIDGYKHRGWKIATGVSAVGILTAIFDYITYHDISSEGEILRVVEEFVPDSSVPQKIKVMLTNLIFACNLTISRGNSHSLLVNNEPDIEQGDGDTFMRSQSPIPGTMAAAYGQNETDQRQPASHGYPANRRRHLFPGGRTERGNTAPDIEARVNGDDFTIRHPRYPNPEKNASPHEIIPLLNPDSSRQERKYGTL
jgi:hypothetical protein